MDDFEKDPSNEFEEEVMFQECRPAGRLFYWVLAGVVTVSGVWLGAREVSARELEKPAVSPKAKSRAADPAVGAASPIPQSGPTMTSVVDTVYTADGTPAQGVLIITWPAFLTAGGAAVAAGDTNVTLGANGALNVTLVANAGATPPGVYYSVVYQLGPGEVRTESWLVPTSSPATLAEVRTTPGAGTAAQPVSAQYVNTALATKANDNAVVHLTGTERVTGTKTFSEPPNVPTPVSTGDVTNKAYVDSSIAAVGAGNYLPTAGGAMTGPLTLSGNPTAPLQAAAKQYVDSSTVVKADLISGLVPTSELGSGTASGLNCLLGSGVWGPCGSSANATAIQSVPVAAGAPGNGQVLTYSSTSGQYAPATPSGGVGSVSVTPAASQSIAQPLGTQFSVNNVSGIRYVTASDNWSVNPSGSLTGGTQATVTLSPCPVGIDTSGYSMYYVYVSAQGTPEPVMVTGGTCVAGAASGTIVFTPRNSHSAGYKISSATSGIQEAINDACGLPGTGNVQNPNGHIVLPATGATSGALPIYGTIWAHCSRSLIEGHGTLLSCSTRDRCMFLGDQVSSNHYGGLTVRGINFTSTVAADGCQVASTQRTSNVVTITTASACSTIQTGDTVNINFTDGVAYWGNHGPVTVSGTSITYAQTGANIVLASTPGTIAIENAAIEDNATPGTIEDVKSSAGGYGTFNQFIVEDDDEAATIRELDADGTQGLTCDANHCGSYVYAVNGGAPVIWVDKANISPQCKGNGITALANNTTKISDSVIQGWAMWAENTQTLLGGYGGTTSDNVYMEEGYGPCYHPYNPSGAGYIFSAAGIIWQGGPELDIRGGEQPGGRVPQFAATGTTTYNYYVIANDTTTGVHSFPLFAGLAETNGSGTITGNFPHIPPQNPGDTVTYDILRMVPSTSAGNGPIFPVKGSCNGGSTSACGSIILAQAQCPGLVCTFTDTASTNTASYTIPNTTWSVELPFWPAAVLVNGNGGTGNASPVMAEIDPPNVVDAANGLAYPRVFSKECNFSDTAGSYGISGGAWKSCQDSGTNFTGNVATILESGLIVGAKGRLNFLSTSPYGVFGVSPGHLLTLVDSNPALTLASPGFRPPASASDTWIGLDNSAYSAFASAQLAFGAPVSISNYIGSKGDNASYLERLTATGKTFNVPVDINGNLTVTGTCTGCGGGGGSGTVNSGTAAQVAMYSANGATVSGDNGLTDNGTTLSYAGSNGIAASSGTFSGNLTVNGQLLVAGPWTVSSPVPGTAMAAAGAGTSALGISSDGNFYISANAGSPQKVATTATSSFFSNLFQEDANDLGEYNGTTAQNLHVYSSYAGSSSWQRTTLGYDATDNLAVVKSENATASSAIGLGFWIGSNVRWAIDSGSTLKPFTNNSFNLGSATFAPQTVYAATSFDTLTQGRTNFELCNDATTGTALNFLAKYNGANPVCVVKAGTSDTDGVIGVVSGGSGTSGNAVITYRGYASCSFDGTTTSGDYVVASTTNGGDCHDAGATRPTGAQVLGRVESSNTGAGTYAVRVALDVPETALSLGDPGASGIVVRNGLNTTIARSLVAGSANVTITNGSGTGGNPTVDVNTSNLFSSPALTGTPTAPTPATADSSTKIATTAWVNAQGYGTGSGNVSGPGSATSGDFASFSGTNGKTIQDSGIAANSLAPLASPVLTGTPTAPTASAGDNSTKIATTAYVRNEAQFAWTCPVAGATTSGVSYCNWTLPAGMTITQFDLAVSTAPAGCTTYPTLQVWDGKANGEVGSFSIAMTSSGGNFYPVVTGSANVAQGEYLRVKVTTGGAGCTTTPAGIVATVTYQMQN